MRQSRDIANAQKRAKYREQSKNVEWMEERAIRARQWRAEKGRPDSGLTVHSISLTETDFDLGIE